MAFVSTRAASRRRVNVGTLSAATLSVLLSAVAGPVSADKVIWANESGNQLRSADLADGDPDEIFDGSAEGIGPCGVAIDPSAGTDGTIYYADFFANRIFSRDLATGAVTSLIEGEQGACGVAVDPATNTIYWATIGGGTIRALTLDGSPAVTLFSGESGAGGVAIDPAGGKIYWTTGDAVRVGSLNGNPPDTETRQDIATNESRPLGVALDLEAGTIYWTNFNSSAIRRAIIDFVPETAPESIVFTGTPPGTLPEAVNAPIGISIDTVGGRFYWANFFNGTIWSAPIGLSAPPAEFGSGPFGTWPNFPVILRAPAGTAPPVISGEASAGSELTCSDGTWAADELAAHLYRAPSRFAYQWKLGVGDIADATASTFTPSAPGDYSCEVTASNHAGSASQTSEAVSVGGTLSLRKLYDANANGPDDSDIAITGWRVQVDGIGTFLTPASVSLNNGTYRVREATPTQSNWVATSPTIVDVPLDGPVAVAEFSNVCLGAGGGNDLGFWKNKNGQALINAADLTALSALNLRTEAGGHFDPTTKSQFGTWIGKATATNMAYSLSAHLASMTLSVRKGMVNGNRLIRAPGATSANSQGFATVSALLIEADTELNAHGVVTGGSPFRVYQTALQDALLRANRNQTFVQPTPCAFSFP